MLQRGKLITLTGTTPSAAGTAIVQTYQDVDLASYELFRVDARIQGATGGTLDVYLQRRVTDNVWFDLGHFTQLAAGAAAVRYTALSGGLINGLPVAVGESTDASGATPAITATFLNGPWGDSVRLVAVAGASTSAGQTITVYATPYRMAA